VFCFQPLGWACKCHVVPHLTPPTRAPSLRPNLRPHLRPILCPNSRSIFVRPILRPISRSTAHAPTPTLQLGHKLDHAPKDADLHARMLCEGFIGCSMVGQRYCTCGSGCRFVIGLPRHAVLYAAVSHEAMGTAAGSCVRGSCLLRCGTRSPRGDPTLAGAPAVHGQMMRMPLRSAHA
jgi:hypothetical protein